MKLKFAGALTFDTDEALQNAMQSVNSLIDSTDDGFLGKDDISPLGLHVTISHSGTATVSQVEGSREILRLLASKAYSGYVDMLIDGEAERFHAKEIAPKEITVEDIAEE